jgi:hypothetical protein
MQEIWQNRPKWWQIWTFQTSGHDNRPRAHRLAPSSPTRAPPGSTCGPATSLIHGISSSANRKPPSKSVWSRDKICSWWIHGPIVIHLELSTDLTTDFLSKLHHMLSSQPPWRSNQRPRMQRRCIQGWAAPPCLLQPISTPTLLYTINRGVWCMVEVTPFKSHSREKHSKILLAH